MLGCHFLEQENLDDSQVAIGSGSSEMFYWAGVHDTMSYGIHRVDPDEGGEYLAVDIDHVIEPILQLITADRKRVALEARIDELEHTFVSYDNVLASEYVENPEWEYGQVVERIAELKAQQEEV